MPQAGELNYVKFSGTCSEALNPRNQLAGEAARNGAACTHNEVGKADPLPGSNRSQKRTVSLRREKS